MAAKIIRGENYISKAVILIGLPSHRNLSSDLAYYLVHSRQPGGEVQLLAIVEVGDFPR